MRTLVVFLALTAPAIAHAPTIFDTNARAIVASDLAQPTCGAGERRVELPEWLRGAQGAPLDWSPRPIPRPIIPSNSCPGGFEPGATGRCLPDCRSGGCRRVRVAQSRTQYYGKDGRSLGTASPQGEGTTRFYGPDGRSLGTSTTDPSGTTRYFGPDGRSLGTSTGPARPPFPERK
jgi:hypothetical protein